MHRNIVMTPINMQKHYTDLSSRVILKNSSKSEIISNLEEERNYNFNFIFLKQKQLLWTEDVHIFRTD